MFVGLLQLWTSLPTTILLLTANRLPLALLPKVWSSAFPGSLTEMQNLRPSTKTIRILTRTQGDSCIRWNWRSTFWGKCPYQVFPFFSPPLTPLPRNSCLLFMEDFAASTDKMIETISYFLLFTRRAFSLSSCAFPLNIFLLWWANGSLRTLDLISSSPCWELTH